MAGVEGKFVIRGSLGVELRPPAPVGFVLHLLLASPGLSDALSAARVPLPVGRGGGGERRE